MKYLKADSLLPFGLLGFLITLLIYVFGPFEDLNIVKKVIFFIILFFPISIGLILLWRSRKKQLRINEEKERQIKELNEKKRLLLEERNVHSKLRYTDQIPKIISSISKFVNEDEKEKFKISTNELLNKMATVFKDIKQVDCCLTLKVFTGNEVVLKTLSRSFSNGRIDRENYLSKGFYDNPDTFIRANSDLTRIAKAEKKSIKAKHLYFFSNDLVHRSGYRHPLLDLKDEEGKDYHDRVNEFDGTEEDREALRQKLWPLPYKSTITVPISYMQLNMDSERFAVIGTLCVDSNQENVFNKNIDKSLLQSLAETIYINYLSATNRGADILN